MFNDIRSYGHSLLGFLAYQAGGLLFAAAIVGFSIYEIRKQVLMGDPAITKFGEFGLGIAASAAVGSKN